MYTAIHCYHHCVTIGSSVSQYTVLGCTHDSKHKTAFAKRTVPRFGASSHVCEQAAMKTDLAFRVLMLLIATRPTKNLAFMIRAIWPAEQNEARLLAIIKLTRFSSSDGTAPQ
ncbi:hypothetical protein F4824DRAFT_284112 [Ustulina deusta]|nr:hypothetical protein F4824DRAFT_284112 [Ustulina deusta]